MPNYPGPYELEFEISMGVLIPARNHKIRVNVALVAPVATGTLLSAILVKKAGGGNASAQAVADQWWSYVRLMYAAGVSCTSVTLWKYVTNSFAKDFVSAGAVALPVGATGSAVALAHQVTLSFRAANGGVIKLVLLETTTAYETSTTLVPLSTGTAQQKIAAYYLSADSIALARDDSYAVAALKNAGGQNERVWRKIYRGT